MFRGMQRYMVVICFWLVCDVSQIDYLKRENNIFNISLIL